jgi:hypothetical protein
VSLEIEQRFKRLEELVIAAAKEQDERTASYFCRLGSVLICGNIERCVELILMARIADRSPPQVRNFLRRFFERGTNYDCERICQLLYSFETRWGQDFEVFLSTNDHLKQSISSCYAIRNQVAHGGVQSLGPKILKQYFDASLDVVAELERVVRA